MAGEEEIPTLEPRLGVVREGVENRGWKLPGGRAPNDPGVDEVVRLRLLALARRRTLPAGHNVPIYTPGSEP